MKYIIMVKVGDQVRSFNLSINPYGCEYLDTSNKPLQYDTFEEAEDILNKLPVGNEYVLYQLFNY